MGYIRSNRLSMSRYIGANAVELGVVEFDQVVHEPVRVDVHLHRPARRERHEGGEQVVARDDPAAVGDLVRPGCRQTGWCRCALGAPAPGAASPRCAASGRGSRRSDRADGSASRPISSPRFSKQNTCSIPGRAIRSAVRCRHASTTSRAWGDVEFGERAGVVAGERDRPRSGHCPVRSRSRRRRSAGRADARRRTGQAGEAVLEDDDVVVGCGHLTGQPGRARAQRALVRRAACRCGPAAAPR